MVTTFFNVIISIDAKTPEAAYDRLCHVLGHAAAHDGDLEYTTDTYEVEDSNERRDTSELFPHNQQHRRVR